MIEKTYTYRQSEQGYDHCDRHRYILRTQQERKPYKNTRQAYLHGDRRG